MVVASLKHELKELERGREQYHVMIPVSNEDGDIDELECVEVISVTWDIAEKRLILNWK